MKHAMNKEGDSCLAPLELLLKHTIFSPICKHFYATESKHRRTLKPQRQEHLSAILCRYPNINHLDLTLCSRVSDISLSIISNACASSFRSIDFSRSRLFFTSGLLGLGLNCKKLVEIDLSNGTELKDSALAAVAEAKNLEKLWLARCKSITDMGWGCVAVGCRKLKFICLKWCLGVGDLGVGLIAVKCKHIRYLDLSNLSITNKCLSSILKLQHLEELVLEGCFGIDDDSLAVLKHGCKSLKSLDMSTCRSISHNGLSSLISGAEGLQQLTLAHGSSVTSFADCLKKLSLLQSVKLDGCMITYDWVENHWKLVCVAKGAELKMESCTLVSREAFVLIGQRCHLLEELDLTDNEIDEKLEL
ncbi:hypothetical protein CRYUN_Cryun05aG0276800 [Craigia yunnanensis]